MTDTKLSLPEKMRLSFDPNDPNNEAFKENPLLAKVWSDDLARNIWLCYAAQHIRDQNHAAQLLRMVAALRAEGHPRSSAHLAGFIHMLAPSFSFSSEEHDLRFAQLIWPYTNGEKNMMWEVAART